VVLRKNHTTPLSGVCVRTIVWIDGRKVEDQVLASEALAEEWLELYLRSYVYARWRCKHKPLAPKAAVLPFVDDNMFPL